MSIQTIIKTFIVASLLSLGLAGVSWSDDPEQKDAGETASVDAAPPADAADEDANTEEAEAADADAEEAEAEKD
jgi:hypothetical protein